MVILPSFFYRLGKLFYVRQKNNSDMFKRTLELKNSLLFLPIHQSLTKRQLEYVGNNVSIIMKGYF